MDRQRAGFKKRFSPIDGKNWGPCIRPLRLITSARSSVPGRHFKAGKRCRRRARRNYPPIWQCIARGQNRLGKIAHPGGRKDSGGRRRRSAGMIDICDFAVGLSRQLYGLTIASERPRHRMMEQWHPWALLASSVRSIFPWPFGPGTAPWPPFAETPRCGSRRARPRFVPSPPSNRRAHLPRQRRGSGHL